MERRRKTIIFILIILIGLALSRYFKLGQYIRNMDSLEEVITLVESNYLLSIGIYLIITILGSSILVLPGASFAILASGLFGPWLGSLYCLIGTSLGAVVSFLLSRYLIRDSVDQIVKKNEKLYKLIFEMGEEKEFQILMITRLLPIFPFNIQNYAYGLSSLSLSKYSLGTFIFMIPGILLFSLATQGLINKEARMTMIILSGTLLIGIFIIGKFIQNYYQKLILGEKDER